MGWNVSWNGEKFTVSYDIDDALIVGASALVGVLFTTVVLLPFCILAKLFGADSIVNFIDNELYRFLLIPSVLFFGTVAFLLNRAQKEEQANILNSVWEDIEKEGIIIRMRDEFEEFVRKLKEKKKKKVELELGITPDEEELEKIMPSTRDMWRAFLPSQNWLNSFIKQRIYENLKKNESKKSRLAETEKIFSETKNIIYKALFDAVMSFSSTYSKEDKEEVGEKVKVKVKLA